MKKLAFIPIVLILLLSCSNDDNGTEVFEPQELEIQTVAHAAIHGSIEELLEQNIVITSQSDWEELIDLMNSNNDVSGSFTETDFDIYQTIAVFDKNRSGMGWNITIIEIIEMETEIALTAEVTTEGSLLNPVRQPFHIVKIPRSDKPVVFERVYPED
ncbi:MAG TPA: hypothetical protein VFD80_01435 [Flavobacteriaceae bacterium]|nr:hypothetical protein [Flavobacteriaceae bacterium]